MEMIEDHTESGKEHINHQAMHKSNEKNIMLYAITSAFYAIFAATAALLAGYHSNEAMIEQMKSSEDLGPPRISPNRAPCLCKTAEGSPDASALKRFSPQRVIIK